MVHLRRELALPRPPEVPARYRHVTLGLRTADITPIAAIPMPPSDATTTAAVTAGLCFAGPVAFTAIQVIETAHQRLSWPCLQATVFGGRGEFHMHSRVVSFCSETRPGSVMKNQFWNLLPSQRAVSSGAV
ncbi:MAG: hypothetical protein QOD41_2444 [Cryptosporangiaceae bacterium]|nr:hypothetical protein [Cryptosporangiaceae bacterium]